MKGKTTEKVKSKEDLPKEPLPNPKINDEEEIVSPEADITVKNKPLNFIQSFLTAKIYSLKFKNEITNGTLKGINNEFEGVKSMILTGNAKFSKDQKDIKEILTAQELKRRSVTVDKEVKKQIIKEAKINKENLESKILSLEENIRLLEINDQNNKSSIKALDNSSLAREVVDENIRKAKLKKIKETKSLLENKLNNVDKQLQELINDENENNKKKLEIKKYLDNFEEDRKKAASKTREWEKQLKERLDKALEYQKKREIELKTVPDANKEEMLHQFEKRKEKIKENALKMQEKNKKTREQIIENITKFKSTKEPSGKHYIYEIREEEFKKKKEDEEDERNAKIAAELMKKKSIFKPISKEELDEFSRKYQEDLQELKLKHERGRMEEKERHNQILSNFSKPETEVYKKIVEEEKETKELTEKQKLDKIYQAMKMKNFSKAVKENIKPIVDEDKKYEIELRIDKLKNSRKYIEHHHRPKKPRILLKKPDPSKPKRLGRKDGKGTWKVDLNKSIQSVRGSRSLSKSKSLRSQSALSRQKIYEEQKDKNPLNKSALSEKFSRSRSTRRDIKKAKKQPMPKPPDYLTEQRMKKDFSKNKDMLKDMKQWNTEDDKRWQKMIQRDKYSLIENVEQVKIKAKLLEENAKRKEQLIQLNGGSERNQKLGEDVSNMLIDAIRAKLTILDNISKK